MRMLRLRLFVDEEAMLLLLLLLLGCGRCGRLVVQESFGLAEHAARGAAVVAACDVMLAMLVVVAFAWSGGRR